MHVARLDYIRDSTTTWETDEGKYIELRQKLILIGPTHLHPFARFSRSLHPPMPTAAERVELARR